MCFINKVAALRIAQVIWPYMYMSVLLTVKHEASVLLTVKQEASVVLTVKQEV